jgi:hypothetical protein
MNVTSPISPNERPNMAEFWPGTRGAASSEAKLENRPVLGRL